MARSTNSRRSYSSKYEMVPPNGGWGYVITASVGLTCIVGIVPVSVFGAVFGSFLAALGDETSATALITGVFNTSLFLAGLPANHLLQKYTYRMVGLFGAGILFLGTFLTIFASSVAYMVCTYCIQGVGFGLMFPSVMSAFNEYFRLKQTVMMSFVQVMIGSAGIIWPTITSKLLQEYGFRGTTIVFSAFSLNGILAMITLQPAKWHYKRKAISEEERVMFVQTPQTSGDNEEFPLESYTSSQEPKENVTNKNNNQVISNIDKIESAGENEEVKIRKSIIQALDLHLFKDPVYVNLAIGTSIALTSDVLFLYIIPALLESYGFEKSNLTFVLTIFFAADLIGKILLGIIGAVFQIRSRYIVLVGSIFIIALRIAYTMYSSFWWIITLSSMLALLRCSIQTTFPLVFSERYGNRFPTAFSLFMVVCGIVSLLAGLLSGLVKNLTGSDTMVVHLLTFMYACCTIPWLVELSIERLSKKTV